MTIEIVVPQLGESITEATIGTWFKQAGEAVVADEPIVELETDKVTVEVYAPASGALAEVLANEGDTVEVGAILGRVEEGAAGAKPAAAPAEAPKEEAKPAPAPAAAPAAAPAPAAPAAAGAAAGVYSPAAMKAAKEAGLPPTPLVSGTGKGGRVTPHDVKSGAVVQALGAAPAAATPKVPAGPRPFADREERVKMTRLRKAIASRLKEAQNTAAMLTTFNEIDMTNCMAVRSQYKDQFEKKHGVRLGFMSFFVKAAIAALQEIPAANAEIEGDEVVYKNYYNIGVAVSSPSGLVVPVLKDADQMSFAGVEKTIGEYGKKARDGKLGIADMQGGSFTISNGGVFGSLMSTPILNPPQVAILGMHKTQMRPVAIDGKVEIRPMMYVALSYDHRIIDGREAVTTLVRIKENIENPERLLLEL